MATMEGEINQDFDFEQYGVRPTYGWHAVRFVHNMTVISKLIHVPDTVATGQAQLFHVLACGPGRVTGHGALIEPQFVKGDYIVATRRMGQVLEFGADNKIIMMPDEAVMGVCEARHENE